MIIALIILTVLIALYLLALRCRRGNRQLTALRGWGYAHRGLHGNGVPENSMEAFRLALEGGYGIELDVHLMADGQLAVIHDASLKRTAGADVQIEDLTIEELPQYRLEGTEEKIPLFTEVLELVAGKVPLLVEIKDDGFGASTVRKTMKILEGYSGEYITESFNPLLLGEVKKCAPSVMRGFLCDKLTAKPQYRALKYRIVQRHLLNFIARPHFIACARESSKMFPIGIIRTLFRPAFIAWTIRSAEEERDARARGFNGVIFEGYIPERARSEADK